MINETKDIIIINSFLSKFNTCISDIGVYSKYLVYCDNEDTIGFLNYDLMYDRAEIVYIYIDEKKRRKHIASYLLDYLFEECSKNNCTNITLEVKQSNIGAIKFYESKDFKSVSKRKNYYEKEDGILMMKEM